MKRKNKNAVLLAILFSTFALTCLPTKTMGSLEVKADEEWTVNNTKILAKTTYSAYNGSDAYIYFSVSPNDYNALENNYLYAGGAPYYKVSDYNFLTYIEVSNDNETYIPFSEIYNTNNANYFFKDGTFRFGLKRDVATIKQVISYQYIKVLKGCEFPSYDYCKNGGTKNKYVQTETTISNLTSLIDGETYGTSTYSEVEQKRMMEFTGIAYGWNNSNYGNAFGFHQLILSFGEYGVDYFTKNHERSTVNQATEMFDVGKKLTFNGIPVYKIHDKYPDTHIGYDHGFAYFYINYPTDVLLMNKNNLVPTLHIEEGTEFLDVLLPEVTLKLVGGVWIVADSGEFKLDDYIDLDTYSTVELPHKVGLNNPHPILHALPSGGAKIAFSVNTGNIDLTSDTALNFDGLYNNLISVYPSAGAVFLVDKDNNEFVQEFYGFTFTKNTDYTFEFEIVCEEKTTVKFAINHFLVIDYTFNKNKSSSPDVWTIDTSGEITIDYYKELEQYRPTINYGGSSSYDFVAGDSLYAFPDVVTAFDLYDDSVNSSYLEFIYEEGAVTDNKYNEGVWTLTIKLEVEGYPTITKEVLINVHGKISTAKIYYDDGDLIEVPIGSKLVPPTNPSTYREGDYDYVFDGWYFEGAKWDFENDLVQGDMHLISKYKQTTPHYVVTANFEGIEKEATSYSLTRGSNLPFDLFDVDGATYEVFLGNEKITSLKVEDDVTITIKYTITYRYVEPVESTCTEDGHIGYWYSEVYAGYYFADSNGREQIKDVVLPKTNHDIIHLDYKDSSCHEVGNVDCYYCNNCHKHFVDEDAKNELVDWSIAKKPHVLTHHDAVDATCEEDGNIEYWTCANEPGVYYGNEECTFELDSIIVRALGHDYRLPSYSWKEVGDTYQCEATISCSHCHDEIKETKTATKVVVREATCSREGQISYSVRFEDERFSAQNKIINTPKAPHTYVYVGELKASGDMDGVKEHYICSECHKYFVKNGENYTEVTYGDLVYKGSTPATYIGCGGNITSTSFIVFISAGALLVLLSLRRKEER